MSTPATLTELIEANRNVARSITYLEGEQSERSVTFGELYTRALGILYHLQKLGAKRGDHLILFLGDNEPFIDAFWGAVLGGIIPVPVALGISDEHAYMIMEYFDAGDLRRRLPMSRPSRSICGTTFACRIAAANATTRPRPRKCRISRAATMSTSRMLKPIRW